jgi:hypothetical protein
VDEEGFQISSGATALVVEVVGWLLWASFVYRARGDVNIVVYAVAATLLFAGGILGMVAGMRNDGRAPGLIAGSLLLLAFIVFQ